MLPLRKDCFQWLILKAVDPRDGKTKYFVKKCLPFGSSISCSHYQRFSNALRHIIEFRTGFRGRAINNYLDDFLFIAFTEMVCNQMIQMFIKLCQELRVPVAFEKTEWAGTLLVFLGIVLDGVNLVLSLPVEKKNKALNLLNDILSKKRAMVKQIQVLTGYLNFLTKAIFAGRTFTRRMYAKISQMATGKNNVALKPFHQIKLDKEFKLDCEIWRTFLTFYHETTICRPMVDLAKVIALVQLKFFTDASASKILGVGGVFNNRWLSAQWEPGYIETLNPSIEYLELYGLVASILTWGEHLRNARITVFCDNSAVVGMVNKMASSCKNCMYILRLLALNNLINNRRVYAHHIRTEVNELADALSRLQYSRFWKLAPPTMNALPTPISPLVWPASAIWQHDLS